MKSSIEFCRSYESYGTKWIDAVYLSGRVRSFLNPSEVPSTVRKFMNSTPHRHTQYDKFHGPEIIYNSGSTCYNTVKKMKEEKTMSCYFTFESFGNYPPKNWKEIAEFLNGIIIDRVEKLGPDPDEDEFREIKDRIWEEFWSGELPDGPVPVTSHDISIDNGHSYVTPAEAVDSVPWETIVNMMDDETREKVHAELAPCSEIEFLTRYLEIAPADLIIG